MIGAVDRWLGRALFVPPIIRFCQRTGWTQYHVHNYLYLVGSYMDLAASLAKSPNDAALPLLLALVFTVKMGRDPGYTGDASTFLRRALLLLEAIHWTAHIGGVSLVVAGPNFDLSCPVGIMWLFAEYARTIKVIPPLEDAKPASERLIEAKATHR